MECIKRGGGLRDGLEGRMRMGYGSRWKNMKAGRKNKGQGMHIERAQPECKGIVLYSTTVPTQIQQCSAYLATPAKRVFGKGTGRALAFKMTISFLFHL